MTALTIIFDLTLSDVASRCQRTPTILRESLQRYFKEIGLSVAYFNTLSSSNRVIALAAEPAVPQKEKLLAICDSAESHLELSAQKITKQAVKVGKDSIHAAANAVPSAKSMAFEYAQQLQRGLCFIKRMRRDLSPSDKSLFKSKTVIVNFSPDASEDTTELMTLFFTYQTFHEQIDVLDFSGNPNPSLQQGCDITGGKYFAFKPFATSLIGLLARNCFTTSVISNMFQKANEKEVDYRFPCRCHNTLVNLGYLCAACLTVHCRPTTKCAACGVKFMPEVDVEDLLKNLPALTNGSSRHIRRKKRDINVEAAGRLPVYPVKKDKKEKTKDGATPAASATSEA
uniref:General transcription factor IIH subunit 3 n=1 Tax=Panagrellus redivivus TaxID=6233 RepID=A0A7E4VID2_PANRE